MNELKQILFDLFDKYEDVENIIHDLRNLGLGEQSYNTIMENYNSWLKEYEKNNWKNYKKVLTNTLKNVIIIIENNKRGKKPWKLSEKVHK